MVNQVVTADKLKVPVGSTICKINISGFSLDNFKTFNPEGYTIVFCLVKTWDGLNYFPHTSKIVLNSNHQSQHKYSYNYS